MRERLREGERRRRSKIVKYAAGVTEVGGIV